MNNHTSKQQKPATGKTTPDARFSHGPVSVAIFSREVMPQNGSPYIGYNVDLRRSFRDGNTYRYTHTLKAEDLPGALKALQEANDWINTQRQQQDAESA